MIATAPTAGTALVVTHTLLTVGETLLRRQLMTDRINPLHLSLSSMLLLNNLVGLVGASAAAAAASEWQQLGGILTARGEDGIDTTEAFYLASSLLAGALYHYAGLKLAALIPATSLLVATNASKIIVVVFGILILADEHSATAIVGCSLALTGNLLYFLSRIRARDEWPGDDLVKSDAQRRARLAAGLADVGDAPLPGPPGGDAEAGGGPDASASRTSSSSRKAKLPCLRTSASRLIQQTHKL